jgi:para-aminobenzoate synthetase component 1
LAFGYLSYDLKNDVEILQSNNFDGLFLDFSSNLKKNIFRELEIQYLTMLRKI